MRNVLIVLSTLIVLVFSGISLAATSSVEWKDTENYRDLKTANGSKKSFREQFFKEIEEHISELVQTLPENNSLKLVITNVDLAGNIQFVGTRQLRIVKEIFMPKIWLSYELTDDSGKVIKSETVEIKDSSFLNHTNSRLERESFGHEKAMLTRWFRSTFKN